MRRSEEEPRVRHVGSTRLDATKRGRKNYNPHDQDAHSADSSFYELATAQAAPVACVVSFYAAGDLKLLMVEMDEQF